MGDEPEEALDPILEEVPPLDSTLLQLADALNSEPEDLSAEVIASIREAATRLGATDTDGGPRYARELPGELASLAAYEGAGPPNLEALSILLPLRPSFLLFREESRDLRSDYNLTEVAEEPPQALANLAALAELDLGQLRESVAGGDYGVVEALVEAANGRLRERFEEWGQGQARVHGHAPASGRARVTVRLRTDEMVLRVLVEVPSGGYTGLGHEDARGPGRLRASRCYRFGKSARRGTLSGMTFTRITVSPAQMGGVPCIRGLRIPVATVVGMLADGMSDAEILGAFPDLEAADLSEALRYAAEAVRERELPLAAAG